MRRWGWRLSALLWVGAVLSACPSLPGEEDTYGLYTVIFDKNGGETEAEPPRKTVKPPATTLDSLPKAPTREGFYFAGWNTKPDGSGTAFTEKTPAQGPVAFVVYAQWDCALSLHLVRKTVSFTPMTDDTYDERSTTLTLRVSGFKNKVDADKLTLDMDSEGPKPWFSWRLTDTTLSENAKAFVIEMDYGGSGFTEAPATLYLRLRNLPRIDECFHSTQALRMVAASGLTKNRPILVHQDNVRHFNNYANAAAGRGRHYLLIENVTLPPPSPGTPSNWVPIGKYNSGTSDPLAEAFTGSFDGGGHTLTGLTLDAPGADYQALFGVTNSGATIENLELEAVNITGKDTVGGMVGWSVKSTVQNSHAAGNVRGKEAVGGMVGRNGGGTLQNSYAAGNVSGNGYVGGLAGWNDNGMLQNSYATGNVSAGGSFVGGLVGWNNGTLQNSYATGNVSSSGSNVGGLVGWNNGMLQNSYAAGNVSGRGYVGGLVGKNDDALQNCVALNPRVMQTDLSYLGRVQGSTIGTLSNNHARDDMNIRFGTASDGTGGTKKTVENNSSGVDGGNASAVQYNDAAFWSVSPLSWDFDNVWAWGPHQLPTLRNVGGAQNHAVQAP